MCKCGLVLATGYGFFSIPGPGSGSRIQLSKQHLDPIGNMLAAEWLHLVMYSSSQQDIIIHNIIRLFWKYLVDIRGVAWLNLCWDYIKRKLFAVSLYVGRVLVQSYFNQRWHASGSVPHSTFVWLININSPMFKLNLKHLLSSLWCR
jgi:hypothetical protein